jgi:hypothetical protein
VLLIGAGLMIKSFLRLRATDLGFNAKNVLIMDFSLPIIQYPTQAQRSAFCHSFGREKSAIKSHS